MGRDKKRFISKKNIKWKIIDIVVYMVIFIISIYGIIINFDTWIGNFKSGGILTSLFVFLVIIFNAFPYVIIYLGLRYAVRKYNKSVVTFNVEQDLEYYREKFTKISPATISLLMDLDVEKNKDLGAMKLYYELNDIYMYMIDGNIVINNPNNIKINKSDEILLKYFFDNKNGLYVFNEWKQNIIRENIDNNLIMLKLSKDRKKVGCGVFLLIHILAFSFIVYYLLNSDYYLGILDTLLTYSQNDESLYNMLVNNTEYMSCFIISLFFAFSCIVYFYSIIGGVIHLIAGNIISVKDKLKRTKEGNILTEKIYGMKNFIKDFSNLDDASKEHLVLWEDFLIYAIVLEENENVLKEISNVYHTDLLKYKNFND